MRVLVTGGAGFIGSHIVDALVAEGHSVAIVDDLSTGKLENLHSGARLHQVSITDARALAEVFELERPEVVNHHAAHIDVRGSVADPAFDARANIIGSLNVLKLCVDHCVRRVVFPSTSAVYSEPRYIPMDESHPVRPQSPYGVAKYAVEGYLRVYAEAYGLSYKTLRYGNVYGPRQNPKGEAGVVAIFTGQLLNGDRPTIYGDGKKTRDYVFVADIVRANLLAMADGGDNDVYNLSCGVEVSDLAIFEAVRRAVGVDVEPGYAPKRPGEADRVALESTKASNVLGWRPAVALQEGINQTVRHIRESSGTAERPIHVSGS